MYILLILIFLFGCSEYDKNFNKLDLLKISNDIMSNDTLSHGKKLYLIDKLNTYEKYENSIYYTLPSFKHLIHYHSKEYDSILYINNYMNNLFSYSNVQYYSYDIFRGFQNYILFSGKFNVNFDSIKIIILNIKVYHKDKIVEYQNINIRDFNRNNKEFGFNFLTYNKPEYISDTIKTIKIKPIYIRFKNDKEYNYIDLNKNYL
jgi:hypothetical protein